MLARLRNVSEMQWLCGLLMLVGVVYGVLFSRHHYVGSFGDDADYVLAAQSLLQGRFVSLWNPFLPALSHFWPGYPLYLVPWVVLLNPNWAWLAASSVVLWLGTLFFWNRLLVGLCSARLRFFATLLLATNPTVCLHAGSVMSDVFIVFLASATFWFLRQWQEQGLRLWFAAFLVSLGWISTVRMTGLILLPAILVALWWEGKKRVAAIVAGFCALMLFPIYLRNYFSTGTVTDYVGLFQVQFRLAPMDVMVMASHAIRYSIQFLTEGLIPFTLEDAKRITPLWVLSAIFIGFCAGVGIFRWGRLATGPHRLVWKSVFLYGLIFAGIHCLWSAMTTRYFLPLLPLMTFGVLLGGQYLIQRLKIPNPWGVLLAGLWLLLNLMGGAKIWANARAWDFRPGFDFPRETFRMISANTRPEDIFFCRAGAIYLYTGRQGFNELYAGTAEEFKYRILQSSVSYVYQDFLPVLATRDAGRLDQQQNRLRIYERVESDPSSYKLVYENKKEQTRIYSVARDPSFVRNYEAFERARQSLLAGDHEEGLRRLKSILDASPRFLPALNAFGAAAVLGENRIGEGRVYLERAVELQPKHALAWLNLSRLYRQQGLTTEAFQAKEKACVAARQGIEFYYAVAEACE